ncbi:MAG: hypothetical protein EZS28_023910 [Streblomastix strix]|uniref:Uncharacterized protein n=1 Tax=Streblomastix strix TaxID=222440 RepID=A0A5J4VDJ1_9EUKA|nr:MAG: hypothetical protein EZS28_023910 [Streblomastix strix]
MGVPSGDLGSTKSITIIHKKSHIKLKFVVAENQFGPMTLKACVKDYGYTQEQKYAFPYEFINTKNRKEELMKTEPFEYEWFKSQFKDASCAYAAKHYSTYFPSKFNLEADMKKVATAHRNDQSQLLINVTDFIVLSHHDFDINGDYNSPNPQTNPFVLTKWFQQNKYNNYKQQDYKAGRDTENNVSPDDFNYYKKLFEISE